MSNELPQVGPTQKDRVFLCVSLGDRNADGKVDVTVATSMRVPVFGWIPPISVTRNVPVEEALRVADAVSSIVPPAAQPFVKTVVGMVRGVVSVIHVMT